MKISKDVLRSSLVSLLGPFIGLITAPIVARSLGPVGRGQVAAVLQPQQSFDLLISAGLPLMLAANAFVPNTVASALRATYKLTLPIFSLFFVSAFLLSRQVANAHGIPMHNVLFAWSFVFWGFLISCLRGIATSRGLWIAGDLERLVLPLNRLAVVLVLSVFGKLNVTAYILAPLLMGAPVSLLILFWSINRPKKRTGLSHQSSTAYEEIPGIQRAVGKTYLWSILQVGYTRLFLSAAVLLLSSRELGMLAIAATISEIVMGLMPLLQRYTQFQSVGGTLESQSHTRRQLFTVVVLISLCLTISVPWTLPFAFGTQFKSAVIPAILMLLGTAAAASASLYTVQFVTQMAPRRAIYCELSGIVVSIIGLAYMAINGTALVAATSYLVSGFTVLFVARLFWKRSVSETKLQQLVFAE